MTTYNTILIMRYTNMFDVIHSSTSIDQRIVARKNISQSTLLMDGLCQTIRDALMIDYNE